MQQNLPVETRVIGEHEYTVTRLGFRDSRRLLATAEKVLGPGIVALLSGFDAQNAVKSIMVMDASTVLSGLMESLGKLGSKESDEVFRVLAAHTEVDDDGKRTRLWTKNNDVLDQWFALYPGECLLWLAFAFEVQYRDFFAEPAREIKEFLENLAKKDKNS